MSNENKFKPELTFFLKSQFPEKFLSGTFMGDDNDASCLVSRFTQTIAKLGQIEAAVDLAFQLQPEGFLHATRFELTEAYKKMLAKDERLAR